jgi:hypothetical protein
LGTNQRFLEVSGGHWWTLPDKPKTAPDLVFYQIKVLEAAPGIEPSQRGAGW